MCLHQWPSVINCSEITTESGLHYVIFNHKYISRLKIPKVTAAGHGERPVPVITTALPKPSYYERGDMAP